MRLFPSMCNIHQAQAALVFLWHFGIVGETESGPLVCLFSVLSAPFGIGIFTSIMYKSVLLWGFPYFGWSSMMIMTPYGKSRGFASHYANWTCMVTPCSYLFCYCRRVHRRRYVMQCRKRCALCVWGSYQRCYQASVNRYVCFCAGACVRACACVCSPFANHSFHAVPRDYMQAFYLRNTLPSETNTHKHPCICCLSRHPPVAPPSASEACDGDRRSPLVVMQGLRKSFGRGAKRFKAVNNLSVNFYANEVCNVLTETPFDWFVPTISERNAPRPETIVVLLQGCAFLGHNGSGKTVTLSMLSGTIRPERGLCTVDGANAMSRKDIRYIRSITGVCVQHNANFPMLTVRENLELVARLRCTAEQSKTQAEVRPRIFVSKLQLNVVAFV